MGRFLKRSPLGRRSSDGEARLYYASDVHGSEQCWRKFLRARDFYRADALVMGGDLTGKAVVPVEAADDGTFSAKFLGERHLASDDRELEQLLRAVRFNGMYPWVASRADIERARSSEQRQGQIFEQVMRQELARWISIADDSLSDAETSATFLMAGNDDPWWVDDVLTGGDRVIFCDDRIVHWNGYELLSSSLANPTPWNSPRELDEDALYSRLNALADQLEKPEAAIFNLHVPPYDSGLDRARELTDDLKPVMRGGEAVEAPVGSKAVRQILEEYQPALALHGHIHESRGQVRIGRTLALNPGSEYNTGRIHGALITLDEGEVRAHQFVVG